MQERCTACQHSLHPKPSLQARRVARVRALAGHWQCWWQRPEFLPFKKALLYARSLKLKSQKEWEAWCKSGARPANMPSSPDKPTSTTGGKGWALAGHWQRCEQRPAVPAVQEGAAARTLPQAEKQEEWEAWCKSVHGLPTCPPPQTELQARRVARVWALAGHWQHAWQRQAVPAVQEGAAVRTLPQAEKPERVGGVVQERCTAGQHSLRPRQIYKHDGWQGCGHWLGTGTVAPKTRSSCRSRRRCCTHAPSS